MAQIPNPYSEFLREPNLLIPGKKPVGAVKIDWGHPYTKGLDVGVLFTANAENPKFLVDNTSGFSWAVADSTAIRARSGGLAVSSASANRLENTTDTFSSLGWYTQASYLVVMGGNETGLDIGLFGVAFPDSECQVWLDTVGGGAGNLSPKMYCGSSVEGSVVATADELFHLTIALSIYQTSGAARNGDMWISGESHLSGASLGSSDYSTKKPAIMTTSGKAGLLSSHLSWCHCAFVWNRRLSPGELRDLSIDPYQFLIPA